MKFSLNFNEPETLRNIADLIDQKKITFNDVIDYTKTKKCNNRDFARLASEVEFIEQLFKKNLIHTDEFLRMVEELRLERGRGVVYNFKKFFNFVLSHQILPFKELFDSFYNELDLSMIQFSNRYSNLLAAEDVKYMFDTITSPSALKEFLKSEVVFLKLLEVVDFKDVVHKFCSARVKEFWDVELCKKFPELTNDEWRCYWDKLFELPSKDVSDQLWRFRGHLWLYDKLMKENIVSFKEITERNENYDVLHYLLDWKFLELSLEQKYASKAEAEWFFNKIKTDNLNTQCWRNLSENNFFMKYILENNLISFEELIDIFRQTNLMEELFNTHCLKESTIAEVFKPLNIEKEQYSYIINKLQKNAEFISFLGKYHSETRSIIEDDKIDLVLLLEKALHIDEAENRDLFSADVYHPACLYMTLKRSSNAIAENEQYSECLINLLSSRNISTIVSFIKKFSDSSLFPVVLKLLQDDDLLYKVGKVFKDNRKSLNSFLMKTEEYEKNPKNYKEFLTHIRIVEFVHQFKLSFKDKKDVIDFFKSQELSKSSLKLTEQKLEVLSRLPDILDSATKLNEFLSLNEIQLERLKQLVDVHLASAYDFETLKSLLHKDDNKKKAKFNL